MNRIAARVTSSLLFTCWIAGCAADVGGAPQASDGPAPNSAADQPLEERLIDREYPYLHGPSRDLVCAAYELVAPDGTVTEGQREWYPIANMNRHLRNVGTPEAVPHIDEAFRTELAERGIDRVETCDDARAYVKLSHEQLERADLDAEYPGTPPDIDAYYESKGGLVDKIINGEPWDHPSTVSIGTGCTGNLLNRYAMLTAAHCVEEGAMWMEIFVKTRPDNAKHCISHPGDGACPTAFPKNVFAIRHPQYDGTTYVYDQAVVFINEGWYGLGADPARWTRVAYDAGLTHLTRFFGAPIQLVGYGVNNDAAEHAGYGRRARGVQLIDGISSSGLLFKTVRETEDDGGICRGDSGAGVFTTALLPFPVTLGIVSHFADVKGACADVGTTRSWHSIVDGQWIMDVVNFMTSSASCERISANIFGATHYYVECF